MYRLLVESGNASSRKCFMISCIFGHWNFTAQSYVEHWIFIASLKQTRTVSQIIHAFVFSDGIYNFDAVWAADLYSVYVQKQILDFYSDVDNGHLIHVWAIQQQFCWYLFIACSFTFIIRVFWFNLQYTWFTTKIKIRNEF